MYAVEGELFEWRQHLPRKVDFCHRRLCAAGGNPLYWEANLVLVKVGVCRRMSICVSSKDKCGTMGLIGQ